MFWLIYKCAFIVLWSTKMTSAIWLTVSKLWEFTVCTLYIVFPFVKTENNNFIKTENNNFIKEMKYVVRDSIACWKPRQSLWEFLSRWKPSTVSQVFTDILLSNSPKRSPPFSPGYEELENMFYFLSHNAFI